MADVLAGWFLAPVISLLVNDVVKKSISYLGSDIPKDLEDLETTLLPEIQLTIQAVQHSSPNHKAQLAKWLERLKNASNNAKDILHKELDKEHHKISSKKKLLEQLNELKEIAAQSKKLRDLLVISGVEGAGNNYVFGRDSYCEEIITFLLVRLGNSSLKKSYSVAAITGVEGAGKTTPVISLLVNDLVKKSISYLGSDIDKDLEDLETILLPEIQLTIQAVQHSSPNHNAQFARWLERLKEAYYDAEDILDGLEYERLRRKVESKVSVRFPIIKPLAKFVNPAVKRPSLLYTLKKKLLDRLKKLKEIAAEAKSFHDLLGIHNTESKDAIITGNNSAVTSSFLIDKVFGRDGDRDEIINFLLDKEGDGSSLTKRYSVVAVTGVGGVGKTTLAQYVYNDKRVKNHFGVRMWLCVSKKFNIINLLKEMIECASEKECPNLSSLDVLQDKLMETLPKSDNIMVVLDDVWYDNNDEEVGENKWENLLKPLIKFASRGGTCKIVVTSRSTSFPFALLPGKLIELSDLAPNDFISLLRYHAIDGLQINDPQLKNDLSDIVDKLRLLEPLAPLVAKVVGNQLCERPDIEFWQATLGNVNLSTDGVIAGENLDALQNKLIVLDDVWWSDLAPDDGSFCDNVLAILASPTRTFKNPFELLPDNILLSDPSPDDFISLFAMGDFPYLQFNTTRLDYFSGTSRSTLLHKLQYLDLSRMIHLALDFISLSAMYPLKYLQLNTPRLENGLGTFKDIIFEDNSSWTRSGFQLGVMVKGEGEEEGYFNGERVQEGVNKSCFKIVFLNAVSISHDSFIRSSLKLKDEVRCLKKEENYYASFLQKNNIKTVEDFLKLYYNDESALRKILRIKSESDEGWKSMVEHDLQCANKYHAKYNDLNNSSHCVLGKKKKEMEKKHLLISSISGGERDREKATLLITHKSSARRLPREDAPAVEEETVEMEAEEREDSDSDSEIGESKIYDVWVQGEHSVVSEEVRDASLYITLDN